TGNYRLNLNYLSSCSLDLGLITVAGCNNTSSLTVQVAGGRPDYLVNIFGPVTRVGTSKTGTYQFTNLPSGQYFVEVFDKNGCTGRKQIQLSNGIASNGVNIQTTATQATCS